MGGVDLNGIESGVRGAPCRIDEEPDQVFDFLYAERPGSGLSERWTDRGRSDRWTFRCQRLAACMVQLGGDPSAFFVNGLGHAVKRLDQCIRIDPRHPDVATSRVVHEQVLGDDQADAPPRASSQYRSIIGGRGRPDSSASHSAVADRTMRLGIDIVPILPSMNR